MNQDVRIKRSDCTSFMLLAQSNRCDMYGRIHPVHTKSNQYRIASFVSIIIEFVFSWISTRFHIRCFVEMAGIRGSEAVRTLYPSEKRISNDFSEIIYSYKVACLPGHTLLPQRTTLMGVPGFTPFIFLLERPLV